MLHMPLNSFWHFDHLYIFSVSIDIVITSNVGVSSELTKNVVTQYNFDLIKNKLNAKKT